jgi:hypothetical protein
MMRTYDGREKAIQHCVIKAREEVEHWRKCRIENRDDVEAENMLRKSQHKVNQVFMLDFFFIFFYSFANS